MRHHEPHRTGFSAIAIAVFTFTAATATAQTNPELPAPSPKARVEQRVGVTDMSVDYSSPGVKGRKIWGALVPFDEMWRAGANAATKLTVSSDFTFGGQKVPKGAYALYAVPGKTSWKIVLNSAADTWGVGNHDPKKDVVSVTVKPEVAPMRERMTFLFSNTTDDATRLDLEWEKLRVSVPITVDTKSAVAANIDKAIDGAWRPHFVSARYLLDNDGDLDRALNLIESSIAIKPTWWNNWIRAQVLAKKGRPVDAVAAGEKAMELGKGDNVYESFFKEQVAKAVGDWKKKKS